jgi:MFS family permease
VILANPTLVGTSASGGAILPGEAGRSRAVVCPGEFGPARLAANTPREPRCASAGTSSSSCRRHGSGRPKRGFVDIEGGAGRHRPTASSRRRARAGRSGLSRLIELNAVNAAADVLVAIALADTLFFSVATLEARSRVALYLVLTMAPFAVVAPVVGPYLDRFRHGRRWAIGTTTAVRGFLCWVMAGAVIAEDVWLYPAAFGCLVASKAFVVTRAAAIPRLLPEGVALVTANSRVSMAAVVGAAVAAPIGVALAVIGSDWPLRLAFLGLAAAVAALTALLWGLVTVVLVALVAGFGQQLGRLSLDAVVQRDVPEHVRASAFAHSDTALQLAWVLGGGLGIVLPLISQLGMAIAAAGLLAGLVAAQRSPGGSGERGVSGSDVEVVGDGAQDSSHLVC